jgi:excisionase family DNA binding protein
MGDPWHSVEKIAENLGISKDTVYAWIATKGCQDIASAASGSSRRLMPTIGFSAATEQTTNATTEVTD